MSRINHIISPQAFELIRDRIAEIVQDELDNQLLLTMDYDLSVTVEIERSTPFDESELPAINISIDTGTWSGKHQGQARGSYVINIDCITSAPADDEKSGDSKSAIKGHRLAGIVRCILEDPQYKTLGYSTDAPNKSFIERVYCNDMKFGNNTQKDAYNQMVSRVIVNVDAIETQQLIVPNLIEGYDTVVKFDNTTKVYNWDGENYG